ncbi:MAG: PQQ-binding-like beta-propeller repeat protein, partial [Gemmatimonadaceae bacterium]
MTKTPAVSARGRLRALGYATALALGAAVHAQTIGGFDPARLLAPAQDSWPTFHGDYSGRRHSTLTQITPDNVRSLSLAWAFQTNQAQQIKATPILVDGILYLTAPDNLWAIDARSGRQIWRHQHPANDAFHIGHRGAAVYDNSVFLTT